LYIAIRVLGFPQTSLLKKLGNISMEIYLLHGIFISFISPLDWNPYIRLVVIVIGSVIAAYSVNKLSILIQRK
jgi:peptidoglycan/LPS O-acetylase OafA/YrhL